MGKRTRMTQQIYTTVKFMLKGGATAEEINAVHPISRETMRRIIRTENFDEYRALQEKYSKQSFENRIAKPEQLTLPAEVMAVPADPVDTVISENHAGTDGNSTGVKRKDCVPAERIDRKGVRIMPRGVPIDENKYAEIKRLLAYDLTQKQIAELAKVSDSVVGNVAGTEDFAGYIQRRDERKDRQTEQPSIIAQQYNINRIHDQLKAQNEQLALIVAYMRDCARTLNEIKESWK